MFNTKSDLHYLSVCDNRELLKFSTGGGGLRINQIKYFLGMILNFLSNKLNESKLLLVYFT